MINNYPKAQSVGEGSERRVLGGVLVAVGGPPNADIEPCDELVTHSEVCPCSWGRLQEPPCDPERDKENKKEAYLY